MGARWWLVGLVLFVPTLASAQAVFDGTTGGQASGSVAGPTIDVSQSTVVGGNAFNSFSSFSVPEGETLTFTDDLQAAPIQNIINRVTGTDVTRIDGTLASTVDGANFYLINPNGVVMGSGSQIDVPASFHVSTANDLRFDSGEVLQANVASSTFTSALPQAFGFSGVPTGDITLEGAQISGQLGANVSLSARSITLADPSNAGVSNTISNSGGYIGLTAVNGAGLVPVGGNYEAPTVSSFGDILATGSLQDPLSDLPSTFLNQVISTNSTGVFLAGKTIGLTAFNAFVQTSQEGVGLIATATSEISLESSNVRMDGLGVVEMSAPAINLISSRIDVMGGHISLSGDSIGVTFSDLSSNAGERDGAGDISLRATRSVTYDGSTLYAFATGSHFYDPVADPGANGGNIEILAGQSILFERGADVMANSSSNTALASGDMIVSAPNIQILEASRLSTRTDDIGNAGNLFVTADSLLIDGFQEIVFGPFSDIIPSSIVANGQGFGATAGNAGKVFLDVNHLSVQNKGAILAVTSNSGNAGTIVICCGTDVRVDGVGSIIQAGTEAGSTGAGGKIYISADSVSLTNGGRMTVATEGSGAAGQINVRTGTFSAVDLNRVPGSADSTASGIGTLSGASGAPGGGGGRIAIEAGTFLLQDGAVVTTDTSGEAPAGTIDIRAGNFIVSGADTRLVSRAVGATGGNAGNITIGANNITFQDGATLSTFSESGAGGNIKLDWNTVTTITGSSVTTEVKSGDLNSGNIFFAVEALPDLGIDYAFLAFCGTLLDIYNGITKYDPTYTGPKTLVVGPGTTISCANAGGGLACRPPTPPNVTCIGDNCNRIDTSSATYPPNPNTRFQVFTPPPIVVVPERNVTARCGRSGQRSALSNSYSGTGHVDEDPSALLPAGASTKRGSASSSTGPCRAG